MIVHALKLSLSEQDLNELLQKYMSPDQTVEDMAVRVHPEGLSICGVYPLFINVNFETHWQISLERGQITLRLARFKAMGVPVNIFKSAIVKMIEDLAGTEPWIRFENDAVRFDIDGCLIKYAFPARTNFKSLVCEKGQIVIEGG
jgi:hypothetical protein